MFKKEYWIFLLMIAVFGLIYALISFINFLTRGKLSKVVHKKVTLGLTLMTFLGLLSSCSMNPTLTGLQDESLSAQVNSDETLNLAVADATLAPTPTPKITPVCYTAAPSPTPSPTITPTMTPTKSPTPMCYTPAPTPSITPQITVTPICYTPVPPPTITPTPTIIVNQDYITRYNIQSDWGNGAVIELTLKNNSNTDINGWNLVWSFSGNQIITNLWNGTFVQNQTDVTVTNANYNAVIPANGGSITLGFQLTYSGLNVIPTSIVLTPK